MDLELLQINFEKCIKGWHMINSSVINETIWEDINVIIFNSIDELKGKVLQVGKKKFIRLID
jgi:hypothetical protein